MHVYKPVKNPYQVLFSVHFKPSVSSYSFTACALEHSFSTSRCVIGLPAARAAPHLTQVRYSSILCLTGSTCRPSSMRVLWPQSGHTVGIDAAMYRRGFVSWLATGGTLTHLTCISICGSRLAGIGSRVWIFRTYFLFTCILPRSL